MIKVDFKLSDRFDVVDKIIFRLVLNGFESVKEIMDALPIFSDTVIANSIKDLVNSQLLIADIDKGRLELSDMMRALLERCSNMMIDIKLNKDADQLVISTKYSKSKQEYDEIRDIKIMLLNELLPGIKIDSYVNLLDFIVKECG